MPRTIVAIGGGQAFVPCQPAETTEIDETTIGLSRHITGRNKVHVLFIPTASSDDMLYCNSIYNHFHLRLGCEYDHLRVIEERPSGKEIARKIDWADIIYVGGGNTRMMMETWAKLGIDNLVRKAFLKGTILTGISAGSICWFSSGLSDSEKFNNEKSWDPIWVQGLGLIDIEHSPHYDSEGWRGHGVVRHVSKTGRKVLTLDDNCALIVTTSMYRVVSSKAGAKARIISQFGTKVINEADDWRPLREII